MNKIATFEKVSFEQFSKDMKDIFYDLYSDRAIQEFYDAIQLPVRATSGSAGYDIRTPVPFILYDWLDVKFPTGLRCKIEDGWMLSIVPRSGLGFKYTTRLANTVGIIDSDYYNAKNEGHIMVKLRTEQSHKGLVDSVEIPQGAAVCQGIFLPYGITTDDLCDGVRTGGFGSTGA